ncbi:adhesion G-protein coupled receptor F1 [Echinops telfairi]|uniref:Adhesion G-protein coupled receptor F1 n=1 Tax=Echinops telfairi TaxID=9371 RepID=A0AC55DGG7_ECHTE|nr:adhesion G-protein coupled receptor F1 [Echinops telfairi]
MMRVGVRGLISFFMILAGHGGLLGRNDDIQTKRELPVNQRKHPGPVHEYELLLQMSYRDPNEKKTLKNFLQLLGPSSLLSHGPLKMIRAKATTYCSSVNGGLQCACEDGYAWFPPTCLDPQQCYLHTERSFRSCNCQGNNLSQSVNFCERTKIWGTFEINEKFTIDLLNSSSAIFSNYTTGIEIQLKGVYKRIQGFESIRVTQFRELITKLKLHHNINAYVEGRCTLVGYEVIGSSSPSELLSAIERAAEQAREALHKLFPLEDDSFRVFGQAQCHNVVFGYGLRNGEYTLPCSQGYVGSITARCQSSGWQVTKESCVLSQLEALKKNLSVIADNITEAAVSSLVKNLSTILKQNPSTTAGNLASVVSLLGNITSLSLARRVKVSNATMEDVINIVDHILNSASLTNWTLLLQEEKHASSRLLEAVETISTLVPPTALPLKLSREFITWKGSPVSKSKLEQGYHFQMEMFPANASMPVRGEVFIGPEQFRKSLPETIISLASLNLRHILPSARLENARINGPVISTVIHNYSIREVFLIFSKIDPNLSQPHCVFWDFSRWQWDSAGCSLVNETPASAMCRCTHLTSFSLLMSPFVPTAITSVVQCITYVGLGVSIGSLVLCLILEALFWKHVRKNQTSHTRHICMVNIALSLLIADVWFIVAASVDPVATPSGFCVAAVFFTHFFYLALFFWMLVLGVLLAYRIVLVFHHMALPVMMAVGFCLGYGCPLVISVITIAVTLPSDGYRRKDVCWLNWSDGSKPLLAFAIPALTIVGVNLTVVLLVLLKLRRPAVGEGMSQDDKATALRMGKSLLILTPLLGLTWGFGLGTLVNSQTLAWHVIFALLNAFQGLFILCFGIFLDSKLRQLLFNKLSPLISWKHSSQQNESELTFKPRFSNSFNPLQHKGIYSLSHTGDSSNDVMLTQFLSTE